MHTLAKKILIALCLVFYVIVKYLNTFFYVHEMRLESKYQQTQSFFKELGMFKLQTYSIKFSAFF